MRWCWSRASRSRNLQGRPPYYAVGGSMSIIWGHMGISRTWATSSMVNVLRVLAAMRTDVVIRQRWETKRGLGDVGYLYCSEPGSARSAFRPTAVMLPSRCDGLFPPTVHQCRIPSQFSYSHVLKAYYDNVREFISEPECDVRQKLEVKFDAWR